MRIDRRSRRCFLRGTCGSLLALPVLEAFRSGEALAKDSTAAVSRPLRFVAIKSYSTQRLVDWYPRFSGNGYKVRAFEEGNGKADGTTVCPHVLSTRCSRRADGREHFAAYAPLVELGRGGSVSNIIGERFNPYLADLLLLRGLDFMPDTSHNDGGMLGNYAAATVRHSDVPAWPTIDQVLAFSPRFYPRPPAGPRSLHLSLGQRNTFSFTHNGKTDGDVVQVQAHVEPASAFYEVFATRSEEERGERRLLIDRVLDDYRETIASTQLGRRDVKVLEHHVELLFELESRLSAEPLRDCTAPSPPDDDARAPLDPGRISRQAQQMIDLALAAIRCDLTRVLTFDVWQAVGRGIGLNGGDLGYAHSAAKGPRDWHDRAHEFGRPEADREVLAINQWIADEIVARLLSGLNEEEEAGESYLYRSLVFWGNELGMNHHNYSVPALLAGQAGGALETGNYVDYIDWHRPLMLTQENAPVIEGVPHNRLLLSLLQALGLRPEDYERSEQRGYGSYKTTGKSRSTHPLDYDASRFGDVLPGLLSGARESSP